MNTKICSCCRNEKDINEFHNKSDSKDGHYPYCKECSSIKRKQHYQNNKEHSKKIMKQYYENNKGKIRKINQKWYFEHQEEMKKYNNKYFNDNKNKILKKQKEYYENNKNIILEKQNKYYYEHKDEIRKKRKEYNKKYRLKYNKEHKEEIKKKKKIYRENNRDKERKFSHYYYHNVLKKDNLFMFKKRIRGLIRTSLDRKGKNKNSYTEEILGCNIEFFIDYLIKTYENNYNEKWKNEYLSKVHIDHIIPLKYAQTEEEIIKYCHYSNLQLLKKKDNLEKGSNIEWELK